MYFLAKHVYCCDLGDAAILLDLRNDAYFGIDIAGVKDLRGRVDNWPHHPEAEFRSSGSDEFNPPIFADLLARGLLIQSATTRNFCPDTTSAPAVAISVAHTTSRTPRLRDLGRFIIALLIVLLAGRRGLSRLLAWLYELQVSNFGKSQAYRDDAPSLLNSFVRTRVYFYTAYRRCLFDSLVLSVYLTRAGVHCTFMVGVAIKPFLAHAWVQIDDWVLNDTAEHVHMFTRILAVSAPKK